MNQNVGVHQEKEPAVFCGERMHKVVQCVGLSALGQIGNAGVKRLIERMLLGLVVKNFSRKLDCIISATIGHADDFTTLFSLAQL